MKATRIGRTLGVLAVVAMAMVPMALASAAFADDPSAESTADVGTGDELLEQWGITNNTLITLTADIEIDLCRGDPYRGPGGSGIVIDGQGLYGITQTCDFTRVLLDEGVEHVTLTGLTHFDGGFACGAGGGLYTNGAATIVDSTINDNVATQNGPCDEAIESDPVGGGVYSDSGTLTVSNSTFDGNHADLAGGGFASRGSTTVTGSTFTGNSAGISGEPSGDDEFAGAGFATLGTATVSGSTFDGNFFGDGEGTCEECGVIGGGFWADDGASVDGSRFSENRANCLEDCGAAGGGFASDEDVVVTASSFSGNNAGCDGDCDALGGAIYSPAVDVTASSFDANVAGCSGDCDNEGGAIFTGEVGVHGSTFTDNRATCQDGCAAYGGAITTVGLAAGSTGQSYGPDVQSFSEGWGDGEASIGAVEPGGVTIANSTFSGNIAACEGGNCGASGGAILSEEPTSFSIDASTFDHNVATYEGGAVVIWADEDPPVWVTNSTVTQNTSGVSGALTLNAGPAQIAYDTIVQNIITEPPVVENAEGDVAANITASEPVFFGTIVALPIGGINCDVAGESSEGYNFSDDDTCGLDQATDKVATPNDPGLGALGTNGGPTQTMLPQTGSPVIDAIPAAACQTGIADGIAVDQRGITRPQAVGCDIGAVEVVPELPPVPIAAVITPKFTG